MSPPDMNNGFLGFMGLIADDMRLVSRELERQVDKMCDQRDLGMSEGLELRAQRFAMIDHVVSAQGLTLFDGDRAGGGGDDGQVGELGQLDHRGAHPAAAADHEDG